MEYYSALKRKEILSHATAWLNLEDIMLSERGPWLKDKQCVSPLIWGIQSSQVHKNRKDA